MANLFADEVLTVPIPNTYKQADKLCKTICSNEVRIQRKIGRKLAKIEKLRASIRKLENEVVSAAGNLITENKALFPILAAYVWNHKPELLQGREAGKFNFGSALAEVYTCPIKPVAENNDWQAACWEILEKMDKDGLRFVSLEPKRDEIKDHMDELETAGVKLVGNGNDQVFRLIPHRPISEKAQNRLTDQRPGQITEL